MFEEFYQLDNPERDRAKGLGLGLAIVRRLSLLLDCPVTLVSESGKGSVFRIAVPEYYAQSCLSCHGTPKGETDLTGYPKEGAALGDLGGVISIKLIP